MLNKTYISEGNVGQSIQAMLLLAVGMGMTTMIQIFLSVLGGQLYQNVESDIDGISTKVFNESVGSANSTGYFSGTIANTPIAAASETIYCNSTALAADTGYTLNDVSGALVVNTGTCNGSSVNATYIYGNPTAEGYIKKTINYSFKANQTQSQYQNILVIAAVLSVALVLIFGAIGSLGLNFGGGYGGNNGNMVL